MPQAAASQAAAGEHKHTNRLAKEQSPYLLQHAHNPVEWYPWGEEAFEAARQQDKPIFLSVGYATCHWCHVMEHESFESEETAAIMNKHFINIKVDREERPDVDRVYMTFVQALTGGGGWPMSVWLTPGELKPFYGGTYYPGTDQYGMPSFPTILRRIAQLWGTKRSELEEQASTIMSQLEALTSSPPASPAGQSSSAAAAADPKRLLAAVQGCAKALMKGYDAKLGGFGGPPKFPRPSEINLLLRAATEQAASGAKPSSKALSAQQLLSASLQSLQAMAAGGMYDQLGGGFHRYSVDEFWHVPHFEKMMYDNPQLALTYLDAFRITLAAQKQQQAAAPATAVAAAAADAGATLVSPAAAPAGDGTASAGSSCSSLAVENERLMDPRVYATVVRGVLDYMRRDMTHPEGGLYSAEDADSLDTATGKKSEGAFYVWTAYEIKSVLGADRAGVFGDVYGVQAGGNCNLSARSDPHQEFTGKNVLMQFKQLSEAPAVQQAGLALDSAQQLLGECRRQLFDVRAGRPRPSLDDKVVTAWNGQAISAYALASRILPAQQPQPQPCFPVEGCAPEVYLAAAVAAAEFVKQQLWDESKGRLRRAFCKAPSAVEGFSDDYALLIAGLLDLYEAGGGLGWLAWAVTLQDTLDSLFWDGSSGGYFQGSGADPSIKLRLKEDYDGAEPAPSSIGAANLLRLAALLPQGASPSSSSSQATASMSYAARADAILVAFSDRIEGAGIAMPQMCAAAWMRLHTPLRQVIVAGSPSQPATQALLNAAHAAWAPDKALLLIDQADAESASFWQQHNPEAWAMVEAHYSKAAAAAAAGAAAGGEVEPTAFVCQNFTCLAPTSSAEKLYEQLSARPGKGAAGGVKLTPVKL
ncbi:hypothetical protein OEZ86_012935 [Tetradesmus obliquus]|nr:hypothetical protein OEZ86_012935 [Tetradesmus obliquus]